MRDKWMPFFSFQMSAQQVDNQTPRVRSFRSAQSMSCSRPGVLPPRQSQYPSCVNDYNWAELQSVCVFFSANYQIRRRLVGQGDAHIFRSVNLLKETLSVKIGLPHNPQNMRLSTLLTTSFQLLSSPICLINNQRGSVGQITEDFDERNQNLDLL